MNHRLAIALSVGIVSFASLARAQQPAGAVPPRPASAPAPAGEKEEAGRFRWGISAVGGYFFGAGYGNPGGGLQVRIGYEISRQFGLFAEPGFFFGAGSNSSTTGTTVSASSSAVALVPVNIVAAYAPVDVFEVGVGPSLVPIAGGASSASTAGGASEKAIAGTGFGAVARAAVVLGGRNEETGRRRGFAISAEFQPIFVSGGPVFTATLGLGYEAF